MSLQWHDRVYVQTRDEWEQLRSHPDSLAGVWSPGKHEGWARFATSTQAKAVRREL